MRRRWQTEDAARSSSSSRGAAHDLHLDRAAEWRAAVTAFLDALE